jgi:hypothetical protein
LRLGWPGPVEAGIYVAVPALLLGLSVRRTWAVLAAATVILAAAAFVPARTVTEHDFDLVTVSTFGLPLDGTTLLASLGALGFAGLGVVLGHSGALLRRVKAAPAS